MKKGLSIKTVIAIGIGAAVFMVLARFAAIPTPIPNTTFNTAYGFLALMAVIFGPVVGMLIGFIGHTISDLISFGLPWFSWIIASSIVGLIIGFANRRLKISEGELSKKDIVVFNIYQVIGNAIAWFLVAPSLDILIYAEPANKVYVQGAVAGILNIITIAVLGTILISSYAKSRVKKGSLDTE